MARPFRKGRAMFVLASRIEAAPASSSPLPLRVSGKCPAARTLPGHSRTPLRAVRAPLHYPPPVVEVTRALLSLLDAGRRGALCTVIDVGGSAPQRVGSRLLLREDGSFVGTVGGGAVEQEVLVRAREVLTSGRSERYRVHLTRELAMCCGGRMEVFIEPVATRPWLIIFGGGHVGAALSRVAATAGFRVHVVDGRPEWSDPARHPDAEVVTPEDPLDVLAGLPWGPETSAIVVTHDHRLDEDLLARCLDLDWRYLGMIGSRAKAHRILRRLAVRGLDPERLARIHSPIGLTLGGQEPGEIAVSIVAELIAVRRGADATRSMNVVPAALETS